MRHIDEETVKPIQSMGSSVPAGGAQPVWVGQAGERIAGISGPKDRIRSPTKTANFRVPDELTPITLREVKNAKRLGFTRQIRDYYLFSRETNRTFILEVRRNTTISKPLQGLIDQGEIVLRRSLP